ncbi:MAG: hypothetical protein AABY28_00410 [Candidatus Omnitrophota bacterium]
MVYLFIGGDSLSKNIQFKKIRQEYLVKETEEFNLDILYAKGLDLKDLQSRLLCLPVKSPKRIVALRDAQELKEEVKGFILQYVKKPPKQVVFILDFNRQEGKDAFLSSLFRYSKVFTFKDVPRSDTFTLSRQINMNKPDYALKVLNQLLKMGEKPERILGGLRYVWEKDTAADFAMKRRLNLLLNCDLDIKTGRMKPHFALEKLVVSLCGLAKPLH